MRARFLIVLGMLALALTLQAPPSAPALAAGATGESLYITNCSGCHGVNGQGAINIAPPLVKNPFVTGAATNAIKAVLGGMIGPVKEHGATWNGSMPSWQGTLTNAQLAAIVSYVRGAWGNGAKPVTAAQVTAVVQAAAPSQRSAGAPAIAARALYVTNCSGCHGTNGEGAINIAPPLAKNPFVVGDPHKVIDAVLGGLVGPVQERGSTWNGSMPPWQGTLSDAQIAAVITYIRHSWGNNAGPVTVGQISASR